MGRGKPFALETITFTTQSMALEFFREMLNRYVPGETVSFDDSKHISSLLKKHPDYSSKAEGGIDHFEVTVADYGTRCFCIVRPDGKIEEFSYKRCVTQRDN